MKERSIEIGRLLLQQRIGRNDFGSRPGIKIRQAEQQRNKKQRHERQSLNPRFQYALDHKTPSTAHEMMQHEQRQASHRNPDPKEIGRQVSAEKRRRKDQRSAGTQHRGNQPHRERALLHEIPAHGPITVHGLLPSC